MSVPQVTASTMRSSSSTDAYSHRVVYMRASANTTTFTAESIMSEKAKPVPLSTSPSSRVPQAAAITAAQVAMQSSTASGRAFTSLRAFPVPLVIRLAPCGRVRVVGWAAGALRAVGRAVRFDLRVGSRYGCRLDGYRLTSLRGVRMCRAAWICRSACRFAPYVRKDRVAAICNVLLDEKAQRLLRPLA